MEIFGWLVMAGLGLALVALGYCLWRECRVWGNTSMGDRAMAVVLVLLGVLLLWQATVR